MTAEWDAEIINERPNELIAWETVACSEIHRAGTVRFELAPGKQGTEVTVQIDYEPPAGRLGATLATPALTHLGGWLGLVCGTLAIYGSFGMVTNATWGRTVIPLGEKPIIS